MDSLPFEATLQAQPPEWMIPAKTAHLKTELPVSKQPSLLTGAGVGVLVLLLAGILFLARRERAERPWLKCRNNWKRLKQRNSNWKAKRRARPRNCSQVAVSAANEGFNKQIAEIRESFKLPPMLTTKTEVLTKQLIEEARKDPNALAQIIRSWLNESK